MSPAVSPSPDGSSVRPLVVLYSRAVGLLTEADPRASTSRVDGRWTVDPGRTFGFGRAPAGVQIAVPLVDGAGRPDPTVPRLAGRVAAPAGCWVVTNHATGSAKLHLTAPGVYRDITSDSPGEPLTRHRQLVTVRSRGGDVEHRFTFIVADAPAPAPPPGAGGGQPWLTGAPTTAHVLPPSWGSGDLRTLAAYCYPELHGLPPRPVERGQQTLRLLDRPVDTASRKWLERQLSRLRSDAARRLGVDLSGERGTPQFIDYVVTHRRLLVDALRELDGRPPWTGRPG